MAHTKNRPGVVVAAAILLFISGGFSILAPACAFGGKAVQQAMPKPPQVGDQKPVDALEIERRLAEAVPSKIYVDYGLLGFGVLFGIFKVVVGMALLKMQGWSRSAAMLAGALSILITLGHVGFQAAIEIPAMQPIMADMFKNLPENARAGAAMGTQIATVGTMVLVVVVVLAYWLTVIFLLSGERVRTAFADAGKEPPPATEDEEKPRSRYEGYDDEGDRPPETGIKE